jgi:hypothetical protein
MNVIEEIKTRLRKYPQVHYQTTASSISISPTSQGGFNVCLSVNPGGTYTISFEGWHEDSLDDEEALGMIAFGLSDQCRLKEYRRGRFAYKWTLESKEEEQWVEQSTTGLFFFPFWKKAEVRILQNTLLNRSDLVDAPQQNPNR